MSTPEHIALGQLAALQHSVDAILNELTRGAAWGGTGDPTRLYWDPAGGGAGARPTSAEYSYDGTFAAIGIFNLSATAVRVSFTPNGSRTDAQALFTLGARAFIVLPYRGTTVSVAGDVAGSVLIVPFEQPQPANAGTF